MSVIKIILKVIVACFLFIVLLAIIVAIFGAGMLHYSNDVKNEYKSNNTSANITDVGPSSTNTNIADVKPSGTSTKIADSTDKKNIVQFDSLKNNAFTYPYIDFSVNSIMISRNEVTFRITNNSADNVEIFKSDVLELRPIKNGKPTKVRSNFTVYRVDGDKLKRMKVLDGVILDGTSVGLNLYPGESAVITQTMPSKFTECDDYAIAYDDNINNKYARLSEVFDCNK